MLLNFSEVVGNVIYSRTEEGVYVNEEYPSIGERKDTKGKRCSTVPSKVRLQRTHSNDGRFMFFLCKMSLVLSRSLRSSQKKTLCLLCTEDFQSHLKLG
jgi:hypothetical protein